MSIEEGKAIKNNCGAIVQFQFNPKLLSDKTGVTRKEHVRYGGTFEDWTSLSCNLFGFPAKKVRMTFFNQQTGEIVHDIKFDEYKSEETLRAEEEIRKVKEEKRKAEEAKRQAEKREMEFIKKNIFFFVDWKTPNGNMNAKYVTMNGENVVLEDEEGKRIEFPAESLDEQNQELLVLAKCFTRVKHKLQKERVWTYANEWIYTDVESDASQKSRKKSSGTSKKSHKKPRTIRGRLLFMTDKALLIEDDKGKKRTVLKSDLIDKDVQWVQRTHQVFLDKLSEYEEKYGVRLLEPINPYDIDPRYIEID